MNDYENKIEKIILHTTNKIKTLNNKWEIEVCISKLIDTVDFHYQKGRVNLKFIEDAKKLYSSENIERLVPSENK
jgi:hypothetical protein